MWLRRELALRAEGTGLEICFRHLLACQQPYYPLSSVELLSV